MGLVFATRRVWVDPGELRRILEEDGYRRLREERELQFGDIVIYAHTGTYTHIGVVSSIESLGTGGTRLVGVMSQWGADGEYLHPIGDVPALLGVPSEFWTDRK